jgi:hypothetical protein
MTKKVPYKSIVGNDLGIGARGELVARGATVAPYQITRPAVTASISISAEAATVANQRDITITLKDSDGHAIDYAELFEILLFSSSAMTDFVATGGSTGIAAGASGKILAVVAKKIFCAITTTAGVCQVIYTDTGTDAGYLAIRLPGGQIIAGGLITNA